jgi:integrase
MAAHEQTGPGRGLAPAIAADRTVSARAESARAEPAAELAARRAELTDRARQLVRQSRASSTWRVYEGQWARFIAWCADHGETALPADPLTICRFLTDLAPHWRPATPADAPGDIVAGHVLLRPGLRPASIAGYLAAISVAHQAEHDPIRPVGSQPGTGIAGGAAAAVNPARHDMVRRVLAGIRRHPTLSPPRRRAALRPEQLAAMLGPMNAARALADARDTALLLVGWKGALRTDDLARLDIGDLVVTGQGLTVHLRRSKTDQTSAGDAVGIATSEPDDPLDAVAAWTVWRNRLAAHGLHRGPAWRGIDRYGRRPREARLTTKSLDAIVARRALAAGLEGDWGGHSLRRGFATSALAGGADERAVQRHGRWKSRTSMDPYIDQAHRFDDTNPTRYLR